MPLKEKGKPLIYMACGVLAKDKTHLFDAIRRSACQIGAVGAVENGEGLIQVGMLRQYAMSVSGVNSRNC
jgi:hypothetical protein